MQKIETLAHVGSDGMLRLEVPVSEKDRDVQVVLIVQPSPTGEAPQTENWWDYLRRARRELQNEGHRFASDDEIKNHVRELRADDKRLDRIHASRAEKPPKKNT